MEKPTNPSSDAISTDISPTDPSLVNSLGGGDRRQSAITASSEERQAASGGNQPRPLRFRYSLIGSLKRPKTIGVDCMGPARRVLLCNTGKSDECLPKPAEEDNIAAKKPSPSREEHVETCTEDAACTELLPPEQGEALSSPSQNSESELVAGRNYEFPEQRKRKADVYAMSEDTSISLTVNMESIGSPSQSNADSRLGEQGCNLFGQGRFDLGGNFHRFTGEHNLSVNSCSVNDKEVNRPSAKGRVEEAAALKYESKQIQDLYDASGRSELSKPPILDGPKKVQFAMICPPGRGESAGFPNSCIMDTKNKQCQLEFAHKQLPVRSVGLLNHANEAKSTLSSFFLKDNSTQSKLHPKPAEMDRVLDYVSSTPVVSVYAGAHERVATDTGVDNLSSHMSSLVLTENQGNGILGSLRESLPYHQQNLKQAGLQSQPKNEVLISKDKITTATAVAASQIQKLRTVTSAQYAPEVRSALGESSGNFRSLDPHSGAHDLAMHLCPDTSNSSAPSTSILPCTTSAFAGHSATSIRWTSGPLISLSAGQALNVLRDQSSHAKENGVRHFNEEPSNARIEEPRVVIKPIEDRAPQEPHVVSKANEDRDQPPEVASSLNKVVVQSSSQSNSEKATGSKEAGVHRKKHYDPDAFFRVNNKIYQRLGKIGSGGSSEVHKVISADCTIYALKKIKLKGRDYSTAYGFCQEIDYLTKLQGKNYIIQLIDYEVTDKRLFRDVMRGDKKIKDGRIEEDAYIYMVLEYGEIDLAQMLIQKWKEMDAGNKRLDENWLRFYWQQILKAVNTIHEERIVHSDLKPANFLLVKGVLKLIDFGIAKAIQSDTTNIQRDSQVGTLNYMSPEAFMCNDQDENGNTIKCGRPSDIWSLGCILYQMVYGRTPFAEFNTFWAKYKEITNKDHKITYAPVSNPWLLDIMKKCLTWNRNERLRIPQLLEHPFLQPPIPPLLLTQKEQHCKALFEISQAYGSVAEICSLCNKLQEHITKQ